MPKEIERKFLVNELPTNLQNYPKHEINQGYIRIEDDGTEERVRKKGSKHMHTIKSGKGLIRQESERVISKEEFEKLWPSTLGKRITKTRYEINFGDVIIELDIYSGDLNALIVAEIEFERENKSLEFKPPSWFGNEITYDERYKNKNLAIYGIPKT
ncbi:MAG: CYTH domain-containing protein [Thermodesulfobacteriota bacterium]